MIDRRKPVVAPIDPGDVRLLQTARRIVGSRHDAEDVVQEAWVRYLQAETDGVRDPERWFHRITRNIALSWRSRERNRKEREAAIARPLLDDSPNEELEQRALRRLASERISRLDDPYRTTLREYVLEGRDAGEIALRHGCSPATVRSRIKRGLERLRERRRPGRRNALAMLLLRWRRAPARWRLGAAGAVGAAGVAVIGALLVVGGLEETDGSRAGSAPSIVLADTVETDVTDARSPVAARDPVSLPALSPPPAEEPPPAPANDALLVNGSVVSVRDRGPVADYRILWAPLDAPDDGEVVWESPAGLLAPFEVGVAAGWIWAEREGWFPSNRFLAERFPAGGEIPLVEEQVVSGRVLDASARPIPFATVRIQMVDAFARTNDEHSVQPPKERVASTDASGRFEVARPWMRPVRATVFAGERLLGTAFVSHNRTDIVLRESASASGRVVDAEGRPAAHAAVHVRPDGADGADGANGERAEWSERCDADGRFRLEKLPPGRIDLLFEQATEEGPVFAARGLDLGPGESREVPDVVLDAGRDIVGGVVAEGGPRGGWIVDARPTVEGGDRRSVRVAADGTFRLRGCWSDAYDLYVYPADGATATLPHAFAKSVRPGSRVTLAVDDAGAPSARLRGRLRVPPQLLDGEVRLELRGDAVPEPLLLEVDEHRFESPSLPPGEYELVALFPGVGGTTVAKTALRPDEDRSLDLTVPVPGSLAIDLGGPVEAGDTVQYRLHGDYASLADWDVEEQRPSVGSNAPELDRERGVLLFPCLLPGTYRVSARGAFPTVSDEVRVEEGRCARLATAAPDGEDCVPVVVRVSAERTLAAGEELEIRHRHEGRWRPLLFWLDVERTNPPLLTYGRFELPPGLHEFEATTTGGLSARARLELTAGMPKTVLAIELRADG